MISEGVTSVVSLYIIRVFSVVTPMYFHASKAEALNGMSSVNDEVKGVGFPLMFLIDCRAEAEG